MRGGDDPDVRHRINAGRTALLAQVDFFQKQFGRVASEWKEDDTRVTFADFAISEKMFAELRGQFPRDDFCSEEANPADEPQELRGTFAWVLDPIDGTNNYALGIPFCAISLALLLEGAPVYGFLYDLSRHTLIQGGPGRGLFDGTQKVTPPTGPLTDQSIIATHFPMPLDRLERLGPLLSAYRVRSLGSCALNLGYTALGKTAGCVDFKTKVWDVAAAAALIQASGQGLVFRGGSPFPLRQFHARMPSMEFYAGGPDFCRRMRDLLSW